MTDYLVDTNHATHMLGASARLGERFELAAGTGANFGVSPTILGELFFASYASERQDLNLRSLRDFIYKVRIWQFDEISAEEFGRIQAEQRRLGHPIPPTDVQIAAVARLNGLTILTADHHFSFVQGLKVENWLT